MKIAIHACKQIATGCRISVFFHRRKGISRGIPVSEHLFAGIPVSGNSGVRAGNSGVRASFRVADDHDGAAHGRCRGDGK